MIDDFDLIVASFQSQYGLRLSREIKSMKWDEFRDLLVGISPDTPLGRIVAIRAEKDRKILEHFTPEQKRIRNEWYGKRVQNLPIGNQEDVLNVLKNTFISMAKEG